MARLKRICPPGIPQHIIQRGNNRQVCFASEDDFCLEDVNDYRTAMTWPEYFRYSQTAWERLASSNRLETNTAVAAA